MILSAQEVKDIRVGMSTNWVNILCDSHEELRKERDELRDKIRRIILEKVTIRETPCENK
jgi:hypothetical protein